MAAYLLMPRRFIQDLSIPEEETLAVELLAGVFRVTPHMIRYRFGLDYQRWLAYSDKSYRLPLMVAETKGDYEYDV